MNITEIFRQIEENCEKTYKADKYTPDMDKKNMLIISHNLDRGGAPLVLLELIDFFKNKYNLVFISLKDGNLAKEFLQKDINIYIASAVQMAKCCKSLWDSLGMVFLNTILSYGFVPFFQNKTIPVIWWLHEPEIVFTRYYNIVTHFSLLSPNFKILSVSHTTHDCIKKYYNVESSILHLGLMDKFSDEVKYNNSKVRFFLPAKFQLVKGQDIIAQAIIDLPDEYLKKSEFVFAGPMDEAQPEYYQLIQKLSVALDNVRMLGEISKEEVYEWYKKVDCVVAPSRADATPTTIVEGMMFRNICLCSDATGISQYMCDGKNGFIVPSEDVDALKEKIMYIIDNIHDLEDIRDKGREIYLKYFDRNVTMKLLEEMME